ncbi:MAG: alpha/beta hydrolase [Alkalinema sp. RU_4_3]|nr:alpha/beta hydrolase [Alkalinema sp. RU_4_3]
MSADQFSHFLPPQNPQPQAPLFIYLPGMDGTGKLLRSQIPNLEKSFDIRRLAIPVDDLTDWNGLVDHIAALIQKELGPEIPRRALYLCGESFGGCLALKLAVKAPELCDRLILVNPASAFRRQAWLRSIAYFKGFLPENLYPLSCIALLPFLANLDRIDGQDRDLLLNVMQSIRFKSAMWRISLLEQFDVDLTQLQQFKQPTLVITSGSDRLLPSQAEGRFLVQQMPRSSLHSVPKGGHSVLLERDVNLHKILLTHGFLERKEEKDPAGLAVDESPTVTKTTQ